MGDSPSPVGAATVAELVVRLRSLRVWAGMSYRDVHREVARSRAARGVPERPSLNTVYRCFELDRAWLDADLVADVAQVMQGDAAMGLWRTACQAVLGRASASAVVTVSDSWPADPSPFVGRHDELSRITALATSGGVVVISGMPGVGKTRLAVRAGQLVASQRPAGIQLVADLRGYHQGSPPADPVAVLSGMQRRLGVPGAALTARDPDTHRHRLRELLTGRQAILLLDDAAGPEQIAPLLVDLPGCLVLVTSRQAMPGLDVTLELSLDVLSPDESVSLLVQATGSDFTGADRPVADRIADSVSRLPLGLVLAAARIRANPGWTLADHLDRLDTHRARLRLDDQLEVAVSLSYQALEPQVRRLLRLLALHPGRDTDLAAASALAGQNLATTGRRLDALTAQHLIRALPGGRYRLHDVIRIHARGRSDDEEPASQRRAALVRLAEYYRDTAVKAANLLTPTRRHRRTPVPVIRWWPRFAGRAEALDWLETERVNILAVATAEELAGTGLVAEFSAALVDFLSTGAYHADSVLLHGRAVAAAQSRGDAARQCSSLNHLSRAHTILGALDHAHRDLSAALDIATGLDDPELRCQTLNNLGIVEGSRGRHRLAIRHLGNALALAERSGDAMSRRVALCNLANIRLRLGDYREAEKHAAAAAAAAHGRGDPDTEGQALSALGRIHLESRSPSRAADYFRRGLTIAQQTGNRRLAVETLTGLGDAACEGSGRGQADDHYLRAARIAGQMG